MKLSLAADGVGPSEMTLELMRSRDSLESVIDMEAIELDVAIDRPSRDLRDIGGETSSIDESCVGGLSKDPSDSFAFALSLSFSLSGRLVKSVRKLGAAGLSFGVIGRCDDGGLVPIGA